MTAVRVRRKKTKQSNNTSLITHPKVVNENPVFNWRQQLVHNMWSQRMDAIRALSAPGTRDLNAECGYPDEISPEQYLQMYERNGVAETVVELYPTETWIADPEVYETERRRLTQFEKTWKKLNERLNIFHFLERADILSGIGRYGILLFGLDDGRDLSDPVPGLDQFGRRGPGWKKLNILYLNAFSEPHAKVTKLEDSSNSPRHGYPVEYEITTAVSGLSGSITTKTQKVHWTRVLHFAEGLRTGNVFGKPRQRPVYNRLLDLIKLLGGSAEMFWKGAFPGYAFDINPEFAAASGLLSDTDEAKKLESDIKDEAYKMAEGLQRYMAMVGVSVKPLTPQVANPLYHIEAQLRDIALTIKCPYSVFMGGESGKLAASQQLRLWNKRVKSRQRKHADPMLLRMFVKYCTLIGELPEIDEILTYWPDLDTLSEQDRADVADKRATTLQKYTTGKVEQYIPPYEFLTVFMGLSAHEAKMIIKAMEKHQEEMLERMRKMAKINSPAQRNGQSNGNGNGRAGGADNFPNGQKVPGGQNPRDVSAPRSRTGAGASGVVSNRKRVKRSKSK